MAMDKLAELDLPPHPDQVKSWDTWKMINFIKCKGEINSKILDVGCNGSPVLPYLHQLGFKKLFGCDVDLKIRKRHFLKRIKNRATGENPDFLINAFLENKDKNYDLSIQDLEKTDYPENSFNFITSLSVIEHGVNIKKYLEEMSRILKPGGFLLTSTDYWDVKIHTESNVYDRPEGDKIFEKEEIQNMLKISKDYGLELFEPMDFEYEDKVVHWKKTDRDYTFLFFCLIKNE